MKATDVIIYKVSHLLMDGMSQPTYKIVVKDTGKNRGEAMLSLTLEELEAYVNRLSEFLKMEKEQEGGAR